MLGEGAKVSEFILLRIQIEKKKLFFFLRGGWGGGRGGDGAGVSKFSLL